MEFGGVYQLKNFLPALAKMPEFRKVQSIGIIRDADENGEIAAFQSVQSSLQSADISAPDHVGKIRAGAPSVGIYILPGDGEAGMLETLVYRTVVDGPINDCINKFFNCVEESGIEQPLNLDKARVFS